MKILHLSHGTLPDWRIEKCALSASRKLGYETMFAGLVPDVTSRVTDSFSRVYRVEWTEGAKFGIPFHWHSTKKQLGRVVLESKPDLVHAHNIFSAKMISEFDIPFVFDDHEYTSVYVRGLAEPVRAHSSTIMLSKPNPNLLKHHIRKIGWGCPIETSCNRLMDKMGERTSIVVCSDYCYH